MENNELRYSWEKIDSAMKQKTIGEFEEIIRTKAKFFLGDEYYRLAISSAIGLGFILFVALVTAFRWDDVYFRINNVLLVLFIIYYQVRKAQKLYQLNRKQADLSVKEWLKYRIDVLSKWQFDNSVYFTLPAGFTFAFLFITIYLESKPLIDVIHSEKILLRLFLGFLSGLSAAMVSVKLMRKKQLANLNHLKDLYKQFNDSASSK